MLRSWVNAATNFAWHPWRVVADVYPPAPTFTEDSVSDLTGLVFMVTGANAGIGYETARILYAKNATVYMANRSEEKTKRAIASIREKHSESSGKLSYILVDLADLTTIAPAVDAFLAREERLHVLINNAGVMVPPVSLRSAQGLDLSMATNCLGPFLLTKRLTPTLVQTARESEAGRVRVVWLSSAALDVYATRNGIDMANLHFDKPYYDEAMRYGCTKTGNYFQSVAYAREQKDTGIISISIQPGNIQSELDRHTPSLFVRFRHAIAYPSVYGAYGELYSALSPDVTQEHVLNGGWVTAFGALGTVRPDVRLGALTKEDGGLGVADAFWQWCHDQVRPYDTDAADAPDTHGKVADGAEPSQAS